VRPTRPDGFTLLEILISMGVFLSVSVAMLAIFTTSVRIYRRGEQARSSDDQGMLLLNLLSQDLARAVPRRQGGHFRAEWLGHANGNVSLGFSVRRDDPGQQPWQQWDFVVWECTDASAGASLRRIVYRGSTSAFLRDPWEEGDEAKNETVGPGLLHFSVALAGIPDGSHYQEFPAAGLGDWNALTDLSGPAGKPSAYKAPAVPHAGRPIYTTIASSAANGEPYPTGMLLRAVLAGVNQDSQATRVLSDDGAEGLRLAGSAVIGRGSILRISDELVGARGMTNGYVQLNRGPDTGSGRAADGPIRVASNGDAESAAGRGLWGSTVPAAGHERGAVVTPGRLLTLVHQFP
jgi:type II secretory pathway component PulJ